MLLPLYPNKSIELDFIDKEELILNAARKFKINSVDAVVLADTLCVLASNFQKTRLGELELTASGDVIDYKEYSTLDFDLQKRFYVMKNIDLFYDKCNNIKVYSEKLPEAEKKLGRNLEIIETNWNQQKYVETLNHLRYLAHLVKGNAIIGYDDSLWSGKIVKFK